MWILRRKNPVQHISKYLLKPGNPWRRAKAIGQSPRKESINRLGFTYRERETTGGTSHDTYKMMSHKARVKREYLIGGFLKI